MSISVCCSRGRICMYIIHGHFTDTSLTFHRYFTNNSHIFHRHFTDISQTVHRYFTNIPQIFHRHFTNISQTIHSSYFSQINKKGQQNSILKRNSQIISCATSLNRPLSFLTLYLSLSLPLPEG